MCHLLQPVLAYTACFLVFVTSPNLLNDLCPAKALRQGLTAKLNKGPQKAHKDNPDNIFSTASYLFSSFPIAVRNTSHDILRYGRSKKKTQSTPFQLCSNELVKCSDDDDARHPYEFIIFFWGVMMTSKSL